MSVEVIVGSPTRRSEHPEKVAQAADVLDTLIDARLLIDETFQDRGPSGGGHGGLHADRLQAVGEALKVLSSRR